MSPNPKNPPVVVPLIPNPTSGSLNLSSSSEKKPLAKLTRAISGTNGGATSAATPVAKSNP